MFKPQQIGLLVSLIGTGLAHADNLPQFQGEEVVVTASRNPSARSCPISA